MPLYRISPELKVSGWLNLRELNFYNSVWGRTVADIFSEETVRRDEQCRLKLDVPHSRVVFKHLDRKFIVRADYLRACERVLGLVHDRTNPDSIANASTSSLDKQRAVEIDDIYKLVEAFSRPDQRHYKPTECRGINVIGHPGVGEYKLALFDSID